MAWRGSGVRVPSAPQFQTYKNTWHRSRWVRVRGRRRAQRAGSSPFSFSLISMPLVPGEAWVDVCEPGAAAVLMALEGLQVDGVGDVRQERVALVLQPLAILGQLGQLLRAGSKALIERGLDLRRQSVVLLLRDRDTAVAVGDELFGDIQRDRPPGAVLPLGGTTGARRRQLFEAFEISMSRSALVVSRALPAAWSPEWRRDRPSTAR